MKKHLFVLIIFILGGCISMSVPSFVRTTNVEWSSIQLRDGIDYDRAFNEVLDVVAKRFEMEMISKDGGYARTGWIHTWNRRAAYTDNYRVRVIFKFSADYSRVDVKTEAQRKFGGNWHMGYDSELLQTIRTDVMGVVGRTAL